MIFYFNFRKPAGCKFSFFFIELNLVLFPVSVYLQFDCITRYSSKLSECLSLLFSVCCRCFPRLFSISKLSFRLFNCLPCEGHVHNGILWQLRSSIWLSWSTVRQIGIVVLRQVLIWWCEFGRNRIFTMLFVMTLSCGLLLSKVDGSRLSKLI